MTRNADWYLTDHPEKWKQDYERRKGPHDCGYFSAKGIPYKPFGNLRALSALDLVEEALSIPITRPYKYRVSCHTHTFMSGLLCCLFV